MRNIRVFYFLEAALSLAGGLILPVYVIYFRLYDVTLFQVALLAAVFEATIIIFELPTGIFADRFGRKLSTAIGFFLLTISGAVFLGWKSFYGFLAAEILFGVGETFISGALEALAVDSTGEGNRSQNLNRLFSTRTIVKTSALSLGMIAGGIIGGAAPEYLFLPFTFIFFAGFLSSFLLKEVHRSRLTGERTSLKVDFKALIESVSRVPVIALLFAVGALVNFSFEGVDQFWQVLLSEIKMVDITYFGLITLSGSLLVLALSRRLEKYYERLRMTLSILLFGAGISIAATAIAPSWSAAAFLILFFALKELIRPVLSTNLNRFYRGNNRATFLSGFNLVNSIGEVLAGLTAGLIVQTTVVPVLFYLSAAVAVGIGGAVVMVVKSKYK
ncbi:MAG: MFS transporter [Candidatus Zixiibacteriota bacterium]